MYYHSQNLTKDESGSIFSHGRAWFYGRGNRDLLHIEWGFGKVADDFSIYVSFGGGDGDDSLCFHLCIPWLFTVWLTFDGIRRCKVERKLGIQVHSGAIWFYPLNNVNEYRSTDRWWQKNHSYYFPWTLDWHSTELLAQDCNTVVWCEQHGHRLKLKGYEEQQAKQKSVSETVPYRYVRKSGEVQERLATYYVERREWRARWWPLIRRKKIRTSLAVNFSDEVGEGTGSWKGGCTGCGTDLSPNETPLDALRRMERERKFDR